MYPLRASCTHVAGTLAKDVLEADRAGVTWWPRARCTLSTRVISRRSESKTSPVISGSVE